MTDTITLAKQCGAYVWTENTEVHASGISYYAKGDAMFTAKQLEAFRQACVKEAVQWQPISTAPKDGRVILLGRFNSHGKWRTMRGEWLSQEYINEYFEDPDGSDPGWYETAVEAEDIPNCWPTNPTHWMPLPAAPEVK